MSKKGGLLKVALGAAAGYAAAFLSDADNRKQAEKVAKQAIATAKEAKSAYEKDPEGFKQTVKQEAEKVSQKLVKSAKKQVASKVGTKKIKTTSKKVQRKKV